MTPTARTLRYLRDLGHVVGVVERYNHVVRRRYDWAGFVDLISVKDGEVFAWQATSGSGVSSRIKKIRAAEHFPAVAEAMQIHVIGWRKVKRKRGGKAVVWRPRIVRVEPEI